MNWNCGRCGADFVVPEGVVNSLMVSATHCRKCTERLSVAFNALYGKVK